MTIIRFTEDYTTNHKLFQANQEWEYTQKYTGNLNREEDCDPCVSPGLWYRVEDDGVTYEIPETVITEGSATEIFYSNNSEKNIPEFNSFKSWADYVTTDAITHYFGSYDFVKAAKVFLGKDIRAKERAEQTDYSAHPKMELTLSLRARGEID